MAETEAIEVLVCETSVSEFESRQSLQIKFPPEADIVTRCADNAVVAGAVPAWWTSTSVEFWGGRLNGMAAVETKGTVLTRTIGR